MRAAFTLAEHAVLAALAHPADPVLLSTQRIPELSNRGIAPVADLGVDRLLAILPRDGLECVLDCLALLRGVDVLAVFLVLFHIVSLVCDPVSSDGVGSDSP